MKVRISKSIAICLILVLLGAGGRPVPAYASTKAEKAREAYMRILKSKSRLQKMSLWNIGETWSDVEYAIIDLNKDGVPELLLRSDDRHYEMLAAYVNGKVKCIGGAPEGTTAGSGRITVYPDRKIVCFTTYHNWSYQSYYEFDGKRLEEKCGTWKLHKQRSYNIKGKDVAAKKFAAYKKKLLKGSKELKMKFEKNKSETKSKKAYYSGVGYLWAELSGRKDSISQISYKEKKVTVKGSLIKASSFGKKGSRLKARSRSFTIAGQCKYYYTTGKGRKSLSRKKFFKKVNDNYSFTGLGIYINSSGKVYRMEVDYSL